MPNYTFKNTEDGSEILITMTISEFVKYEKKNPHMKQIIKAAGIGDPIRLGVKKPDVAFREVLKRIKKGNRGSTIND